MAAVTHTHTHKHIYIHTHIASLFIFVWEVCGAFARVRLSALKVGGFVSARGSRARALRGHTRAILQSLCVLGLRAGVRACAHAPGCGGMRVCASRYMRRLRTRAQRMNLCAWVPECVCLRAGLGCVGMRKYGGVGGACACAQMCSCARMVVRHTRECGLRAEACALM